MNRSSTIRTIFFGSTTDSVIVLNKLFTSHFSLFTLRVCAVVTQPARPVGRKHQLTPTPVETWANERNVPVLTFPSDPKKPWLFADEQVVIDSLQPLKAELLISACYGQKIPWLLIKGTSYGGLNIHPSLLPRWRGADPVPWAILAGDHQTGVSIVTLSEKFDEGKIIEQKKCSIKSTDFSDPVRTKLFAMGAQLLVATLPDYISGKNTSHPQQGNHGTIQQFPYARRLRRDDGFLPWELLKAAMVGAPATTIQQYNNITIARDYLRRQNNWAKEKSLATIIERFFRALSPWPGLWTEVEISEKREVTSKAKRRLKILSCHVSLARPPGRARIPGPSARAGTYPWPVRQGGHVSLDVVQLEGKKQVSWSEFQRGYLNRKRS